MDNKTEVWLRHPEIEKIEVSSFGRVRSSDGHYYNSHKINRGYLNVSIKIDGKWTTKLVHRLIAEAFVPNPNKMTDVNHKDSGRTNNSASNLEWTTHSYNMKYREKFGEPASKPVFAINLNTLEVSHFSSRMEAGKMFGLSVSRISSSVNSLRRQVHEFCFVNDDYLAVDFTKRKLFYLGETKLTAADSASADFVSQVIAE